MELLRTCGVHSVATRSVWFARHISDNQRLSRQILDTQHDFLCGKKRQALLKLPAVLKLMC